VDGGARLTRPLKGRSSTVLHAPVDGGARLTRPSKGRSSTGFHASEEAAL